MTINSMPASRAAKTAGLATTYRVGVGNPYGTCPTTCPLMPEKFKGTGEVDQDYLESELTAVPKQGVSFTYTHFPVDKWVNAYDNARSRGRTTVMNYSADTWGDAIQSVRQGIPTTIAVPEDKVVRYRRGKIRALQCPATYLKEVGCADCGGGKPLCARPDRDYVIVFPAHGVAKKRVMSKDKGGCYTGGGNVWLHANRYSKQEQSDESDSEAVSRFVAGLKRTAIVRHRVIGDIGK